MQLEPLELTKETKYSECSVEGLELEVPLVSGEVDNVTWTPSDLLSGINKLKATIDKDIDKKVEFTVTATDPTGCQTAEATVSVEKKECTTMTAELVTENKSSELIVGCNTGKLVFHMNRANKNGTDSEIKLTYDDINVKGLEKNIIIPADKETFEVSLEAIEGSSPYHKETTLEIECSNCKEGTPITTITLSATQLEPLELTKETKYSECSVEGLELEVPLVSGEVDNVTWTPSDLLSGIDKLKATIDKDIDKKVEFTVTATDPTGCQTAEATVSVEKKGCTTMTAELVTENKSSELIVGCNTGKLVFHMNRTNKNGTDSEIKLTYDDINVKGLEKNIIIPADKETFEIPLEAIEGSSPYHKETTLEIECSNCKEGTPITTITLSATQLEPLKLGEDISYKSCELNGLELNVPLISGQIDNVTWTPSNLLENINKLTANIKGNISSTEFVVTATDTAGCQTATTTVKVEKNECIGMTAEVKSHDQSSNFIMNCNTGELILNITRNNKNGDDTEIKLTFDEDLHLEGLKETYLIPASQSSLEIPLIPSELPESYYYEGTISVKCVNCTTGNTDTIFNVSSAQLEPLLIQDTSYKECEVNGLDIEVPLISGKIGNVVWNPTTGLENINQLTATIGENINRSLNFDVTVIDETRCQTAVAHVSVHKDICIDIEIPPFFTPNNDGVNEVWEVKGLENTTNSLVRLYDRWGKLLHVFNPNNEGWDGTYNGVPCPSTDYWYEIDFDEIDKTYTGHFTLIR